MVNENDGVKTLGAANEINSARNGNVWFFSGLNLGVSRFTAS